MRTRAYLVTFDLADNRPATVRARFADNDVGITRIHKNQWHIGRRDGSADMKRLGKLSNGNTVFLMLASKPVKDYVVSKLGASRCVLLVNAWRNSTPRASLGGLTIKAWLLDHGFTEASDGNPIPTLTRSGTHAAVMGRNFEE